MRKGREWQRAKRSDRSIDRPGSAVRKVEITPELRARYEAPERHTHKKSETNQEHKR